MKKNNLSFRGFYLLVIFIPQIISAQNPGEPFHPETADRAKNIHSTGHRLLWENPDSTIYNVIYFSSDTALVAQMDESVKLYDGAPNTVYDTVHLNLVEPLAWSKKYYWRVVEVYQSGNVAGPVWQFKTMPDPVCEYEVFFDDFENGLGNWTVTNDGGTCVWNTIYGGSRPYTLPQQSEGMVLSADADLCGSGTTTLTTITLDTTINNPFHGIVIEFDNDWRILNSDDAAYVEVSTDDGENWNIVWSQVGVSLRNTHEIVYVNEYHGENLIRFRTVQPGWDWWWAIDNVQIYESCPLTQYYPPYNLKLHTVSQPSPKVELSWEISNMASGFYISRKDGLPTDTSSYVQLAIVNSNVTNFADTTVEYDHIYTYRIFTFTAGSCNEATAYIPDNVVSTGNEPRIPAEFVLYQNYPNPFNPTTSLQYSTGSRQFVTLKVYDILGKEIATIVNEEKPAGVYVVEFDGGILTSGIYYYQLKAGNYTETKKMVLMK